MLERVCRCPEGAYLGAQLASEPVRCERCRGLVDSKARALLTVLHAEAEARLRHEHEHDVACAFGSPTCPEFASKPPDRNTYRRTFRQWLRGQYPLRCGCVIRYSETCEHGWMVRSNGV
jgi:hypothetical protein